jgi:hypothetical protein
LSVIRWILPVWLTLPQAEIYCQLPPRILLSLVARRLVQRARNKVNRGCIDRLLLEAALSKQPIFWGVQQQWNHGDSFYDERKKLIESRRQPMFGEALHG